MSLPSISGVLLHVMGDALGSVVVVIAASIFYALPLENDVPCNWECYIDPSLTIVMVIIILSSAFPLIKETAIILLQMVPKSVNMQMLSKLYFASEAFKATVISGRLLLDYTLKPALNSQEL